MHSHVGEGVVPKYIGLAIVYLILHNHYNLWITSVFVPSKEVVHVLEVRNVLSKYNYW